MNKKIWKERDSEEEKKIKWLEKSYGGKSPSGRYYIFSPKYSEGGQFRTFWQPNNSGYTYDLNQAGVYSQKDIDEGGSYYRNTSHIAIPVENVENGKLGSVMKTVMKTVRN